jgi:hypothetical protein
MFPELLLQKLWWRREFAATDVRTADGRGLSVIAPGRWNRLGGPDFKDAVLELDGQRLRGDVEVHLRAEDWVAHRHAHDPAYAGVVLHVVLFPPKQVFTRGEGERDIPILALLPLLWHDLEEYATDEAIAALLNRAEHRIATELTPLPAEQLARLLRDHAARRWAEKVRFATHRIERLGWVDACHHTALEILGYRANRAGMLRAAGQWPLAEWSAQRVNVNEAFGELSDVWVLQGVRPANHPRHRLRQYATWALASPNWPQRLLDWANGSVMMGDAAVEIPTAEARYRLDFPRRWHELRRIACADVIASPRADNLMADGVLPLLAAQGAMNATAAYAWWWHGYPGDLPDPIRRALRELSLVARRSTPLAIGRAQGLLGWLLERERAEHRLEAAAVRQGA